MSHLSTSIFPSPVFYFHAQRIIAPTIAHEQLKEQIAGSSFSYPGAFRQQGIVSFLMELSHPSRT